MPRGPKGEKRPADAIGNAVMIGRIATGEIEESSEPETKAAVAQNVDPSPSDTTRFTVSPSG